MNDTNKTMMFDVFNDKKNKAGDILVSVYHALEEKGYNPINQMVGYILSGDPTYITSYNNARSMIRKVERDDLLEELLKNYLKINE
ncbi:IreB family regulatory phosphoprotein [Clostridium sp. D2Q-14]|uniref:IreB family regulatory phosphoprotein n=1 Tax=Anaeromonas gelatinilytica TaxID=2683194 RepID=UPI00193BEB22|nr:IreB family regulatory phosphoprotein [Anaeromonas gelatinilytica]MBS4535374.1 IreB family regulatory phosphoprotein [Anaeromonas gelatinilytica]